MDRQTLMANVAQAALDKRIHLSALCKLAGVSTSIAHRYEKGGIAPTLPTIGKLEGALGELGDA